MLAFSFFQFFLFQLVGMLRRLTDRDKRHIGIPDNRYLWAIAPDDSNIDIHSERRYMMYLPPGSLGIAPV